MLIVDEMKATSLKKILVFTDFLEFLLRVAFVRYPPPPSTVSLDINSSSTSNDMNQQHSDTSDHDGRHHPYMIQDIAQSLKTLLRQHICATYEKRNVIVMNEDDGASSPSAAFSSSALSSIPTTVNTVIGT
jgi:hypothetical protein